MGVVKRILICLILGRMAEYHLGEIISPLVIYIIVFIAIIWVEVEVIIGRRDT